MRSLSCVFLLAFGLFIAITLPQQLTIFGYEFANFELEANVDTLPELISQLSNNLLDYHLYREQVSVADAGHRAEVQMLQTFDILVLSERRIVGANHTVLSD